MDAISFFTNSAATECCCQIGAGDTGSHSLIQQDAGLIFTQGSGSQDPVTDAETSTGTLQHKLTLELASIPDELNQSRQLPSLRALPLPPSLISRL